MTWCEAKHIAHLLIGRSECTGAILNVIHDRNLYNNNRVRTYRG